MWQPGLRGGIQTSAQCLTISEGLPGGGKPPPLLIELLHILQVRLNANRAALEMTLERSDKKDFQYRATGVWDACFWPFVLALEQESVWPARGLRPSDLVKERKKERESETSMGHHFSLHPSLHVL